MWFSCGFITVSIKCRILIHLFFQIKWERGPYHFNHGAINQLHPQYTCKSIKHILSPLSLNKYHTIHDTHTPFSPLLPYLLNTPHPNHRAKPNQVVMLEGPKLRLSEKALIPPAVFKTLRLARHTFRSQVHCTYSAGSYCVHASLVDQLVIGATRPYDCYNSFPAIQRTKIDQSQRALHSNKEL